MAGMRAVNSSNFMWILYYWDFIYQKKEMNYNLFTLLFKSQIPHNGMVSYLLSRMILSQFKETFYWSFNVCIIILLINEFKGFFNWEFPTRASFSECFMSMIKFLVIWDHDEAEGVTLTGIRMAHEMDFIF